jgi:autotransporter-associated beta strand protein
MPALAASFSVGGGTITTTQADTVSNSTGTGGPFALQANTVSAGDAITITGVGITNTSQTPNGRALDVGGLLASTGSYSVVMHGSTLAGDSGFSTGGAGAWFQSVGGTVSFDSTGGPANTISGKQGLAVINNTSNGSVSIKTGADRITSSDGEAVYGVAQGTGTISIDSVGATITGGGSYGISAVGGNGAITIGGLNGGIASTINVANGYGIYTSSLGTVRITIASSGVINAQSGIFGAGVATVDTFGSITATGGPAIVADNVTLESGSVTNGQVRGGNENNLFRVVTGANISGTTFDAGAGSNELDLLGGGSGSLVVSTLSNIQVFNKSDSGTWTLTGTTTATTPWTVSGGTLSIANDASLGASSALLTLNGGTLQATASTVGTRAINIGAGGGTFDVAAGAVLNEQGALTGTSILTKTGAGTLNVGGMSSGSNFTGAITVNGGALSIDAGIGGGGNMTINGGSLLVGARTLTFGALSGTGGALKMAGSFLTFASDANTTFAGQITDSGSGQFTKAGNGTLTLTGAATLSTVVISAGALQIGAGGAVGSVAGSIADNGALIFNRSDAATFGGVVSGTGTLAQSGSGTLTLSGVNTYTGPTTVNAGTLNVTGKIASSSVSVANGGTLSGTGTVGATTVANGGTLAPGTAGSPGSLSINGNLVLASGANFVDAITPTAAGFASVSGNAGINGVATTKLASGAYSVGQRFTLITATGGVSGTFSSLTAPGMPLSLKGRLSYDANNVYLNLDPNVLTPLLSNATGNQSNVAKAIDTVVTGGAVPPAGFQALYNLSGPALNSALDQLAGPIGPNVINSVGQGFQSFLSLTGPGGAGGDSFAPGNAYGVAGAPHRAQLGPGEMRIWGSTYGGHVGLSGDAVSGAASLSANNVGFAAGLDAQVNDGLMAGATVGFGRQDFSSGNGTGDSDDVMIGIYARKEAGPLYVSAALGYGWHQITTRRVVTVSGTDVLQGKQDADDIGGRVEAGWRVTLNDRTMLSPYAAVAADGFETPAYVETALSGASTFALAVVAHSITLGRSELGTGLGRNYQMDDGVLAADLRIAWAHQLDDAPFTLASFQNLPGSSFLVAGVRPARDNALLGVSLEMREHSGFFLGLKGETLLGSGTTTVEGMGELGWHW